MSNNKEENEKLLDNSLNRALLALLKFIESEKEKDILIKVPPAFGGRVEYPVIPDPRNTEFKIPWDKKDFIDRYIASA